MKWTDWPELVPDPGHLDRAGGCWLTVWSEPVTTPAIQERLRVFGRREARPYQATIPSCGRRRTVRERLRLAAGLVLLALLVVLGRRP